MSHDHDRFVDLALGEIPPDERAALEEHLATCADCRTAFDAVRIALTELALGLGPRRPAPEVGERLARRVRGDARFWPFVDRLGRLFDLSPDQAEGVLSRIDAPASWSPDGLVRGAEVMLVAAGPAFDGAIASLLRLPPGARYPHHRHLGEERILFLAGGVEHDDGSVADAGMLVESAAGSAHGFRVLPGEPCIAAVLVQGGVELDPDERF